MEHGHSNNTAASILFIIYAWVFNWVQTWSPDDVYTWVFRGLSLISVSLAIIINWRKAMDVIFKKK